MPKEVDERFSAIFGGLAAGLDDLRAVWLDIDAAVTVPGPSPHCDMLFKLLSTCALAIAVATLPACLNSPMLLHPFEGEFAFQVTSVVPASPADTAAAEAHAEGGNVVATGTVVTPCNAALTAEPGNFPAAQGLALELDFATGTRGCSDVEGSVVQHWRASFGVDPGTHRLVVRLRRSMWVFDVATS